MAESTLLSGESRVAAGCTQSVDCLRLARERSASMQRLVAQPPTTFQIVLPLPPGVNNQYVSVGRRRVLSAPAKSFNRDVAKLIAAQRARGQALGGNRASVSEFAASVSTSCIFFKRPTGETSTVA